MPPNRTSELASIIAVNTAKVEEYLTKNGLPPLSFDVGSDVMLHEHSHISRERQAVIDATEELQALTLGPKASLMSQPISYWTTMRAIQQFGVATAFPESREEATYAELAAMTGLPENHLQRFLRHAMTYHIFREPRKGVVCHTAASKLLADDPLMRQWVGMVTDELWPATTKVRGIRATSECLNDEKMASYHVAQVIDALTKWPESEEPENSGYNIANNTNFTFFDEISKNESREKRYASAMTLSSTWPGLEATHVLSSFDWPSLGKGVVVDVGGSHGSLSKTIAQQYPDLSFVVQDQEEVVKIGQELLPLDVMERISFMAHDFFTDQPVLGADVYILRWILHDWSDKYAIRILRALRPALKDNARVLIMEQVLPEPGTIPLFAEKGLRGFDLSMWALHNAKERNLDDWKRLIEAADSRFQVTSINNPRGSRLSVIVVGWK